MNSSQYRHCTPYVYVPQDHRPLTIITQIFRTDDSDIHRVNVKGEGGRLSPFYLFTIDLLRQQISWSGDFEEKIFTFSIAGRHVFGTKTFAWYRSQDLLKHIELVTLYLYIYISSMCLVFGFENIYEFCASRANISCYSIKVSRLSLK